MTALSQQKNSSNVLTKTGLILNDKEVKSLIHQLDEGKAYEVKAKSALIQLDSCGADKDRFVEEANKRLQSVQGRLNTIVNLEAKIVDSKKEIESLVVEKNMYRDKIFELAKPKTKFKIFQEKLIQSTTIILAVVAGVFITKIAN